MSSESDIAADELRHRTIEEVSRITSKVDQVMANIYRSLRTANLAWMKAGVRAVNHSVNVWRERQVI